MPTILALTCTPAPEWLEGRDLLAPGPGRDGSPRILIADNWRRDIYGGVLADQVAAFDGEVKVSLDRLHDVRFLSRQGGEDSAPPDPADPRVPPVEDALYRYLEETGGAARVGD
jgi:hypothetical protein